MPDARDASSDPVVDYDPADAERIERLLEEARRDPTRKQAIYAQLDELIFGLSDAED
jgi:hypothetical protein